MNENPSRPVSTVELAFEILEYLREEGGATIDDVAKRFDVARSTSHRHLRTLAATEWATRSNGEYSASLRFLDVGVDVRSQHPMYRHAKDRVDELAEDTGEKAWCIVEEHGKGIHLYGATGESPVKTYARIGQQTYLHQHAAGKAILAFRPCQEVETIVNEHGLPAITEETITDRDALFEELERVRERGFALNRGESVRGLSAAGAPVTDTSGYAIGAISISGPTHRVEGDTLESEYPELLLEVTNEIEINVNYRDESPTG